MIMGTTESAPENKVEVKNINTSVKVEQKIESKIDSMFDLKQDNNLNCTEESYFIDDIKRGIEKYVISQDGNLIGITNTREDAVNILMEKIDGAYLSEDDSYYLLRDRMLYNVYKRGGMAFLIGYDSLETSFKIQS